MCSKIYGDFSRVLRYLQNKTRQPNFLGRPIIEHFKLVHLASLDVKIPSGSGFITKLRKNTGKKQQFGGWGCPKGHKYQENVLKSGSMACNSISVLYAADCLRFCWQ